MFTIDVQCITHRLSYPINSEYEQQITWLTIHIKKPTLMLQIKY